MSNQMLSGICKCGHRYTINTALPRTIRIEDERGRPHKTTLAKHLVTLCPYCFRLVNIGTGERRGKHYATATMPKL